MINQVPTKNQELNARISKGLSHAHSYVGINTSRPLVETEIPYQGSMRPADVIGKTIQVGDTLLDVKGCTENSLFVVPHASS